MKHIEGEQTTLWNDDVPQPALPFIAPATERAAAQQAPWPAHPKSNRRIQINQQWLSFCLDRSTRKTIGLAVSAQGLRVIAPKKMSTEAIDVAIQQKIDWIARKLTQTQQRQAQACAAQMQWLDGDHLQWMGSHLTLRLQTQHPSGTLVWRQGQHLHIGLGASASAHQLRDAAQAWMQQTAHHYFCERLNHFAPQLNVTWRCLRLSSAKSQWGSAKRDGSIGLHWRLVQMSPEVIDYVVVHELSHLRHMNHSAQFWQTVASVLPDFALRRAQLNGEPLPAW